MRVNLKEEGKKLQAQISGEEDQEPGVQSAFQSFGVRAYRVTNEKLVNKTVAEIEAMPKEMRVFISRIRHEGMIIEPELATVIHKGDVIAVMTRTEALMARGTVIGPKWRTSSSLTFPKNSWTS
jgi:putative transport protein